MVFYDPHPTTYNFKESSLDRQFQFIDVFFKLKFVILSQSIPIHYHQIPCYDCDVIKVCTKV